MSFRSTIPTASHGPDRRPCACARHSPLRRRCDRPERRNPLGRTRARRILGRMNEPRPPTAEEQLAFLRSLQRLLDEQLRLQLQVCAASCNRGCLVRGNEWRRAGPRSRDRSGSWPQVAPFVAGSDSRILSQNTGRQAAIVRELAERHNRYRGSLADLERSSSDWGALRRKVEQTVRKMPLWKLQTVGSERLEFLYRNLDAGTVRLSRVLLSRLLSDHRIEGAWSHFVQRRNPRLLGQVVDLRSFLFGPGHSPCTVPCSAAGPSTANATSGRGRMSRTRWIFNWPTRGDSPRCAPRTMDRANRTRRDELRDGQGPARLARCRIDWAYGRPTTRGDRYGFNRKN